MKKNYKNKQEGIAIYVAVTITAALVLVSFSVINLVLKQISISGAARDSQVAFYAADSGVECALYWDLKNPTVVGQSAFTTTTFPVQQNISCNGVSIPVTAGPLTNGAGTSTFSFTFSPELYCVNVGVYKSYTSGIPTTHIEAKGYNSCDSSNTRRVERAILVNY